MRAEITFLNTSFNSLNIRFVNFKETNDPEEDFKNILKLLPKFISSNWQSVKTNSWEIQRHHLIETDFNFWLSVALKN